jgi:5S rRNA maturation endonuclease (ribonuclease M5)
MYCKGRTGMENDSRMNQSRDGTPVEKTPGSKREHSTRIKTSLTDDDRDLIDLLASLDQKYKDLLFIVEGRQDERALRHLGVKARVVRTQTRLGRVELVDHIVDIAGRNGQVLILTDFDREGKEVCDFLQRELELQKVKVLRGPRRQIRILMGDRRCIEDLEALFRKKDSPEMSI